MALSPFPTHLLLILYYFKNKVHKQNSASSINAPEFTLFPASSLFILVLNSPCCDFPDLTLCFTCFLCLGTYLPTKSPPTLYEWMPFSVVCVQKSPDGKQGIEQGWWTALTAPGCHSNRFWMMISHWRDSIQHNSKSEPTAVDACWSRRVIPIFQPLMPPLKWTKVRTDSLVHRFLMLLPFKKSYVDTSIKIPSKCSHHFHHIWVPSIPLPPLLS